MQHVTFNNVESCWSTMLHPFARGFRMKRPYRGVCMEGFDHILGDNFVLILIKGNVDKPIFFVYIRQTKWFATGRSFVCCKYDYHLINIKNSVNICRLLYCSFFCPHKAFKIFGKDGFPAKNKFITRRPFQLLWICGSRECVIAQSWSLVIKSSETAWKIHFINCCWFF